jgi:hypothetical protein
MNVISQVINLSGVTAGTHLLWQAPTDAQGGGISILSAAIHGAVGTITAALYTLSNQGTPAINGTVCAPFGGTLAVGVPVAATISDGWVDGGEWVGVVTSANAVDAQFLTVNYVMGR